MPQFTGRVLKYPARAAFIYYLLLIALGSAALSHPVCRTPGAKPIHWLDAVFTATSATCVTGLAVRSTEHDFSIYGQAVILILIQVGGIGIMTITTFISIHVAGRASLRQRMIVSETLGAREATDLRGVLRHVFVTTLLIEGAGCLLLLARNAFDLPPKVALWHALFHSISAFCNAGFALYDSSLINYRSDPITNGVICGLIITGGLGYPVLLDLRENWRGPWRERWGRLLVHSKVMILGTVTLLTVGFASILALEWNGVLHGMPLGERLLAAAFHSVTSRTAGFNTIDIARLSAASLFVTILLMMIGAGPCSTAGGFKVSTLMVLVLRGWATFRGYPRANYFRRTIPSSSVEKANATALLFGVVAILALLALLMIEQRSAQHRARLIEQFAQQEQAVTAAKERALQQPRGLFLEIAFETFSALGTVGLSTGITGTLSSPGRLVIIALMFIGRLGPISVFAALSSSEKEPRVAYPTEEPLIG